jgi:hypothetical protein
MKTLRSLYLAAALACVLFVPVLHAQDISKVKTADFSWMTGRWIGHLANATAEQICSQPQAGEMLCLFRIFQNGKPVMFELYTLQDTDNGLELRSLHFPTDLNEKSAQPPLVMNLKKFTKEEIIFAGAPGSQVVTSTLARDSATTMNGTIILTDSNEPHIKVRWEKVDYGAAMK